MIHLKPITLDNISDFKGTSYDNTFIDLYDKRPVNCVFAGFSFALTKAVRCAIFEIRTMF